MSKPYLLSSVSLVVFTTAALAAPPVPPPIVPKPTPVVTAPAVVPVKPVAPVTKTIKPIMTKPTPSANTPKTLVTSGKPGKVNSTVGKPGKPGTNVQSGSVTERPKGLATGAGSRSGPTTKFGRAPQGPDLTPSYQQTLGKPLTPQQLSNAGQGRPSIGTGSTRGATLIGTALAGGALVGVASASQAAMPSSIVSMSGGAATFSAGKPMGPVKPSSGGLAGLDMTASARTSAPVKVGNLTVSKVGEPSAVASGATVGGLSSSASLTGGSPGHAAPVPIIPPVPSSASAPIPSPTAVVTANPPIIFVPIALNLPPPPPPLPVATARLPKAPSVMSVGNGYVVIVGATGAAGAPIDAYSLGYNGPRNAVASFQPSPAQFDKYFMSTYAAKTTSDLQTLLSTRKPTDPDYVTLQNMITIRAADPMSSVVKPAVVTLPQTVTPASRNNTVYSYKLSDGETLTVDGRSLSGNAGVDFNLANMNVPPGARPPLPNPSGAALSDYFTKQYASESLGDLQATLAKRKPSDPDYAALSNLVSVSQYTAQALSSYGGMTIAQLQQIQPTIKSDADKAIVSAVLVNKFKSQISSVSDNDLNNAYTNGVPIEQRIAMSQVYNSEAHFAPIQVVQSDPPSKPKNDPLCGRGISMGCLVSGLDPYNAPKPLLIAETVMVGAVVGLAALPIGMAAAPLLGIAGASLAVGGGGLMSGLAGSAIAGSGVIAAGSLGVFAGTGAGGVIGVLNSI